MEKRLAKCTGLTKKEGTMANYYAYARSNYFRVNDISKFDEFCKNHSFEKIEDKSGRVGFLVNDEDGMPSSQWDEKTEEYVDADPLEELSPLLKKGEVAVVMQIGWEKMRYLTGWATAIDCNGKTVRSDISDIYKLAKKKFKAKVIILCEY